jgi:hypothetical protein
MGMLDIGRAECITIVVVSPRTDRTGVSGMRSSAVGALFGAGYLVFAGLLGFGFMHLANGSPDASPPPAQILPIPDTDNDQNTVTQPPNEPATDSPDSIVNNLSSVPAEPSTPPGGYTEVDGPDDMTTEIPAGWAPVATGDYFQAGDPNDSNRFVRYGATTAPVGDLLSSLASAEQTNTNIQNGYQRVQLASVDYHGDPAVDWEFEFVKAGVTRHVYSRWWETADTEYFVYVSATADQWPDTRPIFDEMANAATP